MADKGKGISKTVSSKPRRGRPRKNSPSEMAFIERFGLINETKSRLGRENVLHQHRAFILIGAGEDPDFNWACNDPAIINGENFQLFRSTILIELGRIKDEEILVMIARQICGLKPNLKVAVSMIRRYRQGSTKQGQATELADVIRNSVNEYLARHPVTGCELIIEAHNSVRSSVEASSGEPGRS